MLLLACLLNPSLAKADEIDPFKIDTGHWMSFERYDDNVKRNRPVGNETLGEALPKIEPPELQAASASADQEKAAEAATAAKTLAGETETTGETPVAAPTRPLNLPILPGVNKGYGLQVNSTLDAPTAPAHIITTRDGAQDMHLQEQNWQDAADVARENVREKEKAEGSDEHQPLDVRMSFLPNPKVVPVTAAQHKSRPPVADVPLPSTPKPLPAETQKAIAECSAALDNYKKKELEAIKSDRQTLQALQSAIADLGLQKQLDFIAGAQQSPTLVAPH